MSTSSQTRHVEGGRVVDQAKQINISHFKMIVFFPSILFTFYDHFCFAIDFFILLSDICATAIPRQGSCLGHMVFEIYGVQELALFKGISLRPLKKIRW